MLAALAASLIVVAAALHGPETRATVYRTDPVLRALGLPMEEPAAAVASLDEVPSLSASPRFVLPLVRHGEKRVLPVRPTPAPAPPSLGAVAAAPAAAVVPLAVPSPPPRVVPKPRLAPAPLTTAVVITPAVPRAGPVRAHGDAMLAIIVDDVGPVAALTLRAIRLPRPVTLAFLPYAEQLDTLTRAAAQKGHEIFLHLPMEPMGQEDPGPNAILTSLGRDEFRRRLLWAFDRLPQATGMNNHMGSRVTADPASMLAVLEEVQRRGLSFVDSRTSPVSVADGLAERLGLPHAARDVFLDNVPSRGAILRQLAEAERLARRRGHALAIGHPYPTTLAVLEKWIPAAEARGLRIVRAGDLIARQRCGEPAILAASACAGGNCPPPPPPGC
jgi:polysaccharide deacetylase 2 family uncharacterized protein YibQ